MPEATTDTPLQWFIVNTFSGYENTVKKSLEDRIKKNELEECFEDILVPSEQVIEQRGKRQVKQTRKFFPGYIFVRMRLTKPAWHLVKNTPKVSGFLSSGKTPKPVSQREMDRMLGKTEPKQVTEEEVVVPDIDYSVGDQVRVKSGAFANFSGEVEEVNTEKRKIKLSVSIFGRPTRVEVDFSEVEPDSPS
ncbi:transcription termination/antitermination protein NusG [Plesiocystis pacifica]|uniref:transcription termination/antitermination protein NusG n=1 Tax=Plesiocystis pacifica TaxID=191768 RepID=UPI0002E763F8|nr:transcription termination/antitermination protein NusG [Plesiocystis pacifica]